MEYEWMTWAKSTNSLQVDISSYCNARCAGCVRNQEGDEVRPEVPMEHFPEDVWERLVTQDTRGWYLTELTLNGNWGDPMMHPKLVEMLQLYNRYHPESALYLHTNGSMRTKKFWTELGKTARMFTNHSVIFAIDGMDDTHDYYRRMTSFDKICENIKAFVSGGGRAQVVMTLFEHNKHQVREVERLAKDLGCYGFNLRHSHGDDLRVVLPTTMYTVKANYDFEPYEVMWEHDLPLSDLRDYDNWLDATDMFIENRKDHKCPWYADKKIQIDPWGQVWPCCHLSLYGIEISSHNLDEMVNTSAFIQAREQNNLKESTLTEILNGSWWGHTLNDAVENAEWKQCRDICGICK